MGQHNEVYKWRHDNRDIFQAWWITTEWYKSNTVGIARPTLPMWGTKKNAAGWEYFSEGANRSNGEPVITCHRCDKSMAHAFKHGTKTMTAHTTTKGCLSAAKTKGIFSQPTIREGYMASV